MLPRNLNRYIYVGVIVEAVCLIAKNSILASMADRDIENFLVESWVVDRFFGQLLHCTMGLTFKDI